MRIFLMIDLHLSAFAPRWRFLYVVRIDAYTVREHCVSMLPFTIPQTAVER